MSAEELLEKLEDYLKSQNINTEEEYNQAILRFMENLNDVENLENNELNNEDDEEEIYYSLPEDSAKRIAEKTLEKNPNDYIARIFLASIMPNLEKRINLYVEIIDLIQKELEEKDILNNENYMGSFWIFPEGRIYLKTKYRYVLTLIELKRYLEAIEACEEIINLVSSDNLGIRYVLANLYCLENMGEKLLDLFNNYEEKSIRMLVPLAIYYYKNNNYEKTFEYIKLINDANAFFINYVKGDVFLTEEEIEDIENSDSYLMGTIDEIYIYFIENNYLLNSTDFLDWIKENY